MLPSSARDTRATVKSHKRTFTMERSTLIIVYRWQHPFDEEGSGVSSYWRVADLISKNNRRKEMACAKDGLQLNQMVDWSMNQ